jgi:type IV pilus assembly protein PilW
MVGMALGIFLVGGVVSVYISSQKNFKTTENLSRIQENARYAFEQMGREIREEGSTPCGIKTVANVVRKRGDLTQTPWWANWSNGTLVGYEGGASTPLTVEDAAFGTAANDRVANTDAISILRAAMDEGALRVIQSHDIADNKLLVPSVQGYESNDVVLACDEVSGAILEIASATDGNTEKSMAYDDDVPGSNCTDKLGWQLRADCTGATNKTFVPGGFVAKYDPAFWYVGVSLDDANKRSLYRLALTKRNNAPLVEKREMVTDVTDLQVQYLTRNNAVETLDLATTWVDADDNKFSAGGWTKDNDNEIIAVRLTLTFTSPDAVGTDGNRLQRSTVAVIALRNRENRS